MGLLKQKLRAFSIHFLISLIIIGGFFLYTIFILYTPPILKLEGGQTISVILLVVDLTLGPLMTGILYKKGKKGLKLDLTIVVVLQLSAFLYGAHILYSQRPLFLAYVIDNIKIMPASVIDISTLKDETLRPTLFSGPRLVYVERPQGEKAQEIMWDAIGGGKDIEGYPELYRPFSDFEEAVREKIYSPDNLPTNQQEAQQAILERLQGTGLMLDDVYVAPVMGHESEGAAIIDKRDLTIIDYIYIMVW